MRHEDQHYDSIDPHENEDAPALDAYFTHQEAMRHPSALRLGVRRVAALAAIALVAVGVIEGPKIIGNANQAAHEAAAGRVVPSTEAGQIHTAEQTIQKNEASRNLPPSKP